MSQISPPLRILLAGSVLFLAAWFTILSPGEEAVTPPADQAQSAAGEIAQQAEAAADGASVAAQQHAGEAAATAPTAPGTAAQAQPAAPAPVADIKGKEALRKAGVPAKVAAALDKKVVAIAFVNRAAADDRRVAGAMKKVYRHDGRVWVHTADIEDVSKYAPITRGAEVAQSPSVLVVDKHRSVTPLVGYVDSVSINQAVVDALLVDGLPVDDSPYLKTVEGACGDLNRRVRKLREPGNLKQFRAYVAALGAIGDRFYPRIRSAKPPKKYRSLHRQILALVNADERIFRSFETAVRTGRLPAAAIASNVRTVRKQSRKLDLRLAGLGMDDCR